MPFLIGGGMLASNVLGGVIGNAASSDDQESARALQLKALQGMQNINTPTMQDLMLQLQNYQSAGKITPQLEGTVTQAQSNLSNIPTLGNISTLGNIQTNPALMQAQMGALQKLQSLGNGGLQPEDAAALAGIQRDADITANAQNQAVLQNMQQMGQGGSGAQLAAQLANAQAAANRKNQAGLNIGAQATQRALQSIMASGQLGGQIQGQQFGQQMGQQAQQFGQEMGKQGQQFGQQAQVGNAQDAINRFNAANSQQVMGSNTNAVNNAQYSNLGNAQGVLDKNTGVANTQAAHNANVPQQVFQNSLDKQRGVYGAQQGLANQDLANAANTQNMWSNIGNGVSSAIGAGAAYELGKEKLKK